jgi:hypothetical protein
MAGKDGQDLIEYALIARNASGRGRGLFAAHHYAGGQHDLFENRKPPQ